MEGHQIWSEEKKGSQNTVDGQNLHHLRTPGMIRFPNKYRQTMVSTVVSKWCRMSSIHSREGCRPSTVGPPQKKVEFLVFRKRRLDCSCVPWTTPTKRGSISLATAQERAVLQEVLDLEQRSGGRLGERGGGVLALAATVKAPFWVVFKRQPRIIRRAVFGKKAPKCSDVSGKGYQMDIQGLPRLKRTPYASRRQNHPLCLCVFAWTFVWVCRVQGR